jgi:hypothetical protein
MKHRLVRWTGPLAGALLLLAVFLGLALLYMRTPMGGLSAFVKDGLQSPFARAFAWKLAYSEVLPLYLVCGLLLWCLSLVWAGLPWTLGRAWWSRWTGWQAFGLTTLALGWLHILLWWKVPTALWLVPGLNRIPFGVLFPLLALGLVVGAWALIRRVASPFRVLATLAGWLCLWSAFAQVPFWLTSTRASVAASPVPVKVLMVGLDGLRDDTATEVGLPTFQGTRYPNAYTCIPATRLLYGILWGGDPEQYSTGHLFPSIEEMEGKFPFETVLLARIKGLKPRFFIDDGGTIGLAGRSDAFDAVEMPARGWENFVNSNLAQHIPLYAAWLNVFRVFPTTTPWTPLDAGLRQALEQGRGSGWVMYHSCLAHSPIYLTRKELAEIPGWWRISPVGFRPLGSWAMLDDKLAAAWNPKADPFRAYTIRNRHILDAWKGIWNGLDQDPNYRDAVKVLFSDHGERFYHVTDTIRLQGVHGFDIDPWEARIPLLVWNPHPPKAARGSEDAVSLLDLRRALYQHLIKGAPFSVDPPPGHRAFIRYHTINGLFLREPAKDYRQFSAEGIIKGVAFGPDGLWALQYEQPASERNKDVAVAEAVKDLLTVYKPLKAGGAHKLVYQGYVRQESVEIPEEAFIKVKKEIEAHYFQKNIKDR